MKLSIQGRLFGMAGLLGVFVLLLAFLLPLGVSLLAVNRPYDAVPDQDLIWVSDALKLYRDIPPRYIDHPGSYWPLSTAWKLDFFGANGVGFLSVRPGQLASPDLVSQLVVWNRIEQGLICTLLAFVFYWLSRLILNKAWLSALIAGIFSVSYGTLFQAVQPRNESTSMLFLLLSYCLVIDAFKNRQNHGNSHWRRRLFCFLGIVCFLFSFYCKLQIVPLALLGLILLIVWFRWSQQASSFSLWPTQFGRQVPHLLSRANYFWPLAVFFVGSMILYGISARGWLSDLPIIFYGAESWKGVPYRDLVIFPLLFWPLLFMLLALICQQAAPWLRWHPWRSYGAWLIAVFSSYFAFIASLPQNWSKHVFTIPLSLLWRSELYAKQINIDPALRDVSAWSPDWTVLIFVALLSCLLLSAVLSRQARPLILAVLGLLAMVIFLYNATRYQPFYAIYFLPPVLLVLAGVLDSEVLNARSSKAVKVFDLGGYILAFSLIAGIGLQSILMVSDIPNMVSYRQPPMALCYQRQGMDSLLANTAVGSCKDFSILKLD